MSKIYFDHISKTIKARDLIFGTGALYGLENKVLQSGHQVAPLIFFKKNCDIIIAPGS